MSPFPAGTSAESKLPDDITSSTSSVMTMQGMPQMGNAFGMENESVMQDPSTDSKHFFELVHVKYQLPRRSVSKQDWVEDVSRPLQVTIKDIFSDLQQYANGFPRERIPHCSETERSAKQSQR